MFERFTSQSRRVVVLAQEEARMLDHNYIGTEHLLLGLLHEGQGSAARALEAAGVTLGAAREQVTSAIGRGQQQASGHIPFTPRAKKSLELALREALQLGDGYIGTGHVLLGLIHEGSNMAIKVLSQLGTDVKDLRARVTQEMHDHPEQGREPSTAEGELRRVRVRAFPREGVQTLLDKIEDRLSAIERRLGIARPGSPALRSLDEQIAEVRRDKEAAVDEQDFAQAATLRDREKQLIEERARVEQDESAAAAAAPADEEPAEAGGSDPGGSGAGPAAAGTGEVSGEPDELTRLRARVAHLEERLREHDLDPDEPEKPPAAAG
jgi:ATP-dependent Clp protease ATP-binding subunit ClpA